MPTQPHLYSDNPNAKRILIVCDEGMNRSHTIKGQLQYWGHDIITVGLNRNSDFTIRVLAEWAQLIILTARDQDKVFSKRIRSQRALLNPITARTQLWDIGEDKYPRPYNPELLSIVRKLIDEHKDELAPIKEK